MRSMPFRDTRFLTPKFVPLLLMAIIASLPPGCTHNAPIPPLGNGSDQTIGPRQWILGHPYTITDESGGESGSPTLSQKGRVLYIPRGDHTLALDLAAGVVIANMPGTDHADSVAIAPGSGRGFIPDGPAGLVVIFDVNNFHLLGRIRLGDAAVTSIYDPSSDRILCFCHDPAVMLTFDPAVSPSGASPEPPLQLEGTLTAAAVDGKGKAFVLMTDKNQIAVIDTIAKKIIAQWPIGHSNAAQSHTCIAYDPDHQRLIIADSAGNMVIMSAVDGIILARLRMSAEINAVGYCLQTVFALSGNTGTLTAVRETSPGLFEVVQTLKMTPGATTMAVDPNTGYIYLPVTVSENQTASHGILRILVVKPY